MRSYKTGDNIRVPTYISDLVEIIGNNPGHVIGSTACLGGFLPSCLLRYKNTGNKEEIIKAKNWIKCMKTIFGTKNFFLEMQPSKNEEQIYVNKQLYLLAEEFNIGYIITTDSHYLNKAEAQIHKAFLNSQDGEREVDEFYSTTYLMDTEELCSYFEYFSEDILQEAFNYINYIQNQCQDFSLLKPLLIPELIWLPINKVRNITKYIQDIPYLGKFFNSSYHGDVHLAYAILEGLDKHPECKNEKGYAAINECLEMTWISSEVNKAHWSAYFLNLQNIINTCWEAGSLVGPGRGSGVGFILLYLLDITQINPLAETVQTKSWRFLNPARVSVLDVDFDIEGGRRSIVLNKFREVYGNNRVAGVATFGTEKSKSAILTAARGLGIEVDKAQYISSLIPEDRGQIRTLSQCYYGDIEAGFAPVRQFIIEMNNMPELWQVAQRIEGLICRVGIHAGGVIFVDEDFTNSTGLMRAPDGTIITSFDLHDCESCSLIKYDALSIEALDKIHVCLDLLIEAKLIQKEASLKETYEKVIGIYNLERDNLNMWKMTWEHKILSLFQMEEQSGIQGIALTKPESVEDLAHLNSVIRLMAQEKGAEQPLEKYARFKNDITLWYKEMTDAGLTKEEQEILKPYVIGSYGIAESQECFMQLVQIPECGGFDLNFADQLRKSIAKKNPAEYEKLTKIYFENAKEKELSKNLCNYVWNTLIATSRGYGFNASHTLAYSLIALQEMNLAYKYPILYWNCACLIVDSGSLEDNSQSTDYSKTAKAIGKMKDMGVQISLINVNQSEFSFVPDIKENKIWYGLKGLSNVGDEIVEKIIINRPYSSPKDFLIKVSPNKQAMISLIKGGGFDEMMPRKKVMAWYIWETCDKKSRLTLQNLNSLIKMEVIKPENKELEKALRYYYFNNYLKDLCLMPKTAGFYKLDLRCINFLTEMGLEHIILPNNIMSILAWENKYEEAKNIFRKYITLYKDRYMQELNDKIFYQDWKKYAEGSEADWEMESLCFYYHPHPLKQVKNYKYGIDNFEDLSEEPEINSYINIKGAKVPIYKINKICGTCIAKNKNKSMVTLLTTSGVVTLKFRKEYFTMFDKRISEKKSDGTKKVIENSWFDRGNMIMVQGIRQGDSFRVKKYANTSGHELYKINAILPNGELLIQSERVKGEYEQDD